MSELLHFADIHPFWTFVYLALITGSISSSAYHFANRTGTKSE